MQFCEDRRRADHPPRCAETRQPPRSLSSELTKLTWGRWKGGTDHGPDCATRQEDEQLRRVAGRVVDEGVPTFGAGTPGEDDRLLTAVGDHGTMEQNSKTKKNWPSRGRWRKNRGFEPTRVEIQCSELNVQKSKFKHKIKIQSPVVKSQHRGLPASTVVRTKVHVHNQSWRRDLPLLFAQLGPLQLRKSFTNGRLPLVSVKLHLWTTAFGSASFRGDDFSLHFLQEKNPFSEPSREVLLLRPFFFSSFSLSFS